MCFVGVLWQFSSQDARSALAVKRQYCEVLKKHAGWEIDEFAANLVYSELVSNVVRHTGGGIQIRLVCDRSDVFVEIIDQGAGFDYTEPPAVNALSESGRGLFLTSRYSSDLRIVAQKGIGTTVKAALRKKQL